MVRRDGTIPPDIYINQLISFLRHRTGYNFVNFVSPRHLQNLASELSFNRVPVAVWNSLLTTALRITNMSTSIYHRMREFGALFIDCLVWVCRQLSRMGIIRIALFLYNWSVNPLVRAAIVLLSQVVHSLLDDLWIRFSEFVQSHLRHAPYYNHFQRISIM